MTAVLNPGYSSRSSGELKRMKQMKNNNKNSAGAALPELLILLVWTGSSICHFVKRGRNSNMQEGLRTLVVGQGFSNSNLHTKYPASSLNCTSCFRSWWAWDFIFLTSSQMMPMVLVLDHALSERLDPLSSLLILMPFLATLFPCWPSTSSAGLRLVCRVCLRTWGQNRMVSHHYAGRLEEVQLWVSQAQKTAGRGLAGLVMSSSRADAPVLAII